MDDLRRSASFWDHEHAEAEFRSWMEHPLIHTAINRRIGGGRAMWPLDWLAKSLEGRTFARALSLGCGTGAFERDLVRRGLCRSVDALDLSVASVAEACSIAKREGLDAALRYFVADFNRLSLPAARYDLVLFHQSLHHVDALEDLLSTILNTLVPEGLLFLDEYVGPSRTWWTPSRFSHVRFVYDRLPESVRAQRKLPLPIHGYDPSEAIRSGEILSRIGIGFETLVERPYGGNLLAPIYPALQGGGTEEVIAGLIEQEDVYLSEYDDSHYRIILARPRKGKARMSAVAKYRVLGAMHEAGVRRAIQGLGRARRRLWIALDRRVRRKPIDHYT